MSAVRKPLRLGEMLVEKGLINQDQLHIALTEQKKRTTAVPLGKIFVQLGFVTESLIQDVLGESLGHEGIDLSKTVPQPEALALMPKELARRYNMLPIFYEPAKMTLTVAMSDTFNVVAMDQAIALLGGDLNLIPLLAGETEIEAAIDIFYGFELSIDGILHELETGEVDYNSIQGKVDEYSHPVVRLVDALMVDAVKRGASDIHFEPEAGYVRIRYRIDGVLRQVKTLHQNYWSGISVRLKVMAGMNIAESRSPQDGRISRTIAGRPVDFRTASQPTIHGENIVLRILDRQKGIVPLEKLNFTEEALSLLKLMMARPEGIILVTGPTGSGKTTTLYSMLNFRNSEAVNIMTLEDPVEYPMTLIRQSSVNEAVKLNFATGIRSIMRQDPDIILIGEIRDEDTAEMAFRAAMTGHQVYSTLHTNYAIGAIPRLLDIGVLPDIIAGNLIGIVAQRLVRRLCNHCKTPYEPNNIERQLLGIVEQRPLVTLYQAQGCDHCEQQGYKGRFALMEILKMDPEIDEMIARRATVREVSNYAQSMGFQTLVDDGIRRVFEGVTSLDEVSRVVDLTGRIV